MKEPITKTSLEDQIIACFPTKQGIYTKSSFKKVLLNVLTVIHQYQLEKLDDKLYEIIKTLDKRPKLTYHGRSIDIKSDGYEYSTNIFVDGKELKNVVACIVKMFPTAMVTVEMELADFGNP